MYGSDEVAWAPTIRVDRRRRVLGEVHGHGTVRAGARESVVRGSRCVSRAVAAPSLRSLTVSEAAIDRGQAASSYSWMSPPRTSRRRIALVLPVRPDDIVSRGGGVRSRLRCGRPRL